MSHPVVDAIRHAVQTGDLEPLEPLLADDVQWHGSGPGGGCRSRDDVLATFRGLLDEGVRPDLHDEHRHGDRLLVGAGQAWLVLSFQDDRVAEIQDYSSRAAAEHDLALTSAPPGPPIETLVPFVHVADVQRSVAFYSLLGFEARDTYAPDGELEWAWLATDGAALMLARADEPIEPSEQAVLFYLYAPDLEAVRDHLVARRIRPAPGEIVDGTPGPRREMRVTDPDGYCLMVAQTRAANASSTQVSGSSSHAA
jgi:hypothetical protein